MQNLHETLQALATRPVDPTPDALALACLLMTPNPTRESIAEAIGLTVDDLDDLPAFTEAWAIRQRPAVAA